MKLSPLFCSLLILGAPPLTAQDAIDPAVQILKQRERKVRAVVERAMPSVVAVVSDEGGMAATGSGVVVSKEGLIMTAGHVTEAAGTELTIIFPGGRRAKGESLGANLSRDAGFAKITEEGDWPAVEVGDSDRVELGDWVVAMGHPGGYELTRTPPVRLGRVVNKGVLGMIGTDCTLVGGDSGGPLFDLEGKVIGIHSSIGGSLAENRHVPSSVYEHDRERMLAGDVWGSLAMMSAGLSADRPMLGVRMRDGDGGVVIDGFVSGSPAETAGAAAGDLIIAIDGMEVVRSESLADYVSSQRAGDVVQIKVRRGDDVKNLKVELARWEDLAGGVDRREDKPRLGVMLDREADSRGATVHEVIEDSPAAEADLRKGDVVVAIDGREIADVPAMEELFAKMAPGDEIEVEIRRGDTTQKLPVTLGKR